MSDSTYTDTKGNKWEIPWHMLVGFQQALRKDPSSVGELADWLPRFAKLINNPIPEERSSGSPDPRTMFERHLDEVFHEAKMLLLAKHHDYGPHNIGASPGGALNGLRVRIWDKVARINNLIDKGVDPKNESLRDSFLDLANYAAIALVVMDGNWPDE